MKQAVDFLEVIPWGREFQISPLTSHSFSRILEALINDTE